MAKDTPRAHPPEDPTAPLDFNEFPVVELAVWRQAAQESNGGKPLESLTTATPEGISLQPIYTNEDTAGLAFASTMPGMTPFVRGSTAAGYLEAPWLVAQELAYPTPALFNRALLDDLAHGQTAVNILLDGPTRAGRDPDQAQPGEVGLGGLSLATVEDVAAALQGVDLAATPIMIRVGTAALPVLALLSAHLRRQGRDVAQLHGWLEDDPLGVLAHEGTLPLSLARAYDEMAAVTRWAARHSPQLGTLAVHTYPYHNAGGSAVHELAFGLATGVAYLRALQERGIPVNVTAPRLRFDFAVGPQFFMEVAKLRAARLLWAQVVAAFGGDAAAQRLNLHARTGRANKTLTDAHANMLRVTTETLAAALGGAASVHVAPYDEPAGLPDAFSRRIARNVQIILQEEVHLTQLVDPAGGTWAVEALVNELAQDAWALFQRVEAAGGMHAALVSGLVQAEISATAAQRAAHLATRRSVLVGTNLFANPAETLPAPAGVNYPAIYRDRAAQLAHHRAHDDDALAHTDALARLAAMLDAPLDQFVQAAIDAARAGATLNEITRTLRLDDSGRPLITPLPQQRAAEPFEALRRDAAGFAESTGHPPAVFLATFGPVKQHKARADFAQDFFAPGGFAVIRPPGFATAADAAAAALSSNAVATVICSSDETYPDLVPPFAAAIKRVRPDMPVLVAGRPGALEQDYRAAGVDTFIYLGADCLAVNRWLMDVIRQEDQTA